MPATVICNCGTNLAVDDTAKGTNIVCPQCGAAVTNTDIIYDAEEVNEGSVVSCCQDQAK